MRKSNKPNNEQIKELYHVASEFKKMQPWKWLDDADIICVEDPKNKTIGYCSVMGRAGEHFALGVYLGDRGIFGFYNLMEHGDTIPNHQLLHYHDCLMCSFEDRDLLANEDRKQIKDLGLSFRGRNAWPMFRRYEPGYNPWFINEEECIFLTAALRQILIVVSSILKEQLRLNLEEGRTILRYSEEKEGNLEWYSKEKKVAVPELVCSPVTITDEVLIKKIKNAGSMGNVTIQMDICYMPTGVQENKSERPYFPRIFVLVKQKTGQILGFEMYDSIRDDANAVLKKLINLCLEKGSPKEIQVRSEKMTAILNDFCKMAGIKLKVVKRLPSVDEMMEEMAFRL